MTDLTARLRAGLTAAMRARDRTAVRALRTALAAVANAEAQPVADPAPASLLADGPIAGAVAGLGAAEVARRELSEDDVRQIVRAERDGYAAAGATPEAAVLDALL